ncbi:MAG: Ig-like domain-containing protein, partial [Candidatus Hodarchaeota archaeon]
TWKSEAISRYQSIAGKLNSEKSDSDNNGTYFDEFDVTITSPAANSVNQGNVTIQASVVEYGDWNFLYGVTNVEFYIDSTLISNQTVNSSSRRAPTVFQTEWD